MASRRNKLIIITGPTGSGKSEIALQLARRVGCDIISADSRQIYRGLPITTAAPTAEQLAQVRHHFVGTLDLDQYYSAAQFEADVMALLPSLWEKSPVQIMCGGSMMYVDAIMRGIDQLPTISDDVRTYCMDLYNAEGLPAVLAQLDSLDPEYGRQVDRQNHRRVIHALEICLQSGNTYSSLRTGRIVERPFDIEAYYIDIPREQLFERINARVERMLDAGMLDEVAAVAHLRHLNSLNTVGVKEMLHVIDGDWPLPFATARLQKNTRVYAKKQLLWLRSRPAIRPLPDDDLLI